MFVPFALPDEKVRVRLVEEKRSYARAELLEVLEPAPERVEARCPHYGLCGGCHYQHMPYEMQLTAKREVLRDQLQRIGKLEAPNVLKTVPTPEPWNYRNHVQFHLTRQGKLGYHTHTTNKVFPIQECHLPEAPINELWPQLDIEVLPGLERIGLRIDAGENLMLMLESRDPKPPEFEVDLPISAVHLSAEDSRVLSGTYYQVMEILGRPFRVTAGAFFQVNNTVAEAMVQHILDMLPEFVPLSAHTVLLDVYCGVGLFSAFLAGRVGKLVGIEASPQACEDFVINLDEFDNVELFEAPAETVMPILDDEPDVILVDPPRAGLDTEVLDSIVELAPEVLVYVSCDPATLGRDAKRLTNAGFRLAQITPFDMFPQTYHIESISFWVNES